MPCKDRSRPQEKPPKGNCEVIVGVLPFNRSREDMCRESMAWREVFLGFPYILSGNDKESSRLRRLLKNFITRFLLVAFLSMSPDFMAPLYAAEIWYFPMQGRNTRPCILRSEDSIDELWDKLERETSTSWSIPTDMNMFQSIVLQSTKLNKEYSLAKSRSLRI
jgi:hypothetical protein